MFAGDGDLRLFPSLHPLPLSQAGTEVFVRDWTKAVIRIAVRDSRMREHDPLMGVVDLQVKELFKDSSQVSGGYSIQDGVGYGKVNCHFVFKAVQMDLPRSLRGWDTATVELLSNIQVEGIDADWDAKLKSQKITVTTGDATEKLTTASKLASTRNEDTDEPLARLPVYDRYSSQLAFKIGGGGLGNGKPLAVSSLSLSEIVDDEETDLELPIYAGEKLGTLIRNHLDDFTEKTHKYHKVGTLRVKACLDSGLDLDHEKLAIGQTDRHAYEVKDRVELEPKVAEQNSHANDDGVIDKDEQKQIDRAKNQALHSRHRGSYGYSAVRGAVWSKDNAKNKVRSIKNSITGKKDRDQTVKSEV